MAKQQPDSLRRDHTPHSISDPYLNPEYNDPDGWSDRSWHNWAAYMRPVHEQLPDQRHRKWYRRVYRPTYSTPGVVERDAVGGYNEEDYVAETVATRLFDDKEFLQRKQRRVAQIRHDRDLGAIGNTIADCIETVVAERPNGATPSVTPDSDYPVAELPFTPAIAISSHRQPE